MKNIIFPLLCAIVSGVVVAFGTGAVKITQLPFIAKEQSDQGIYVAAYLENGKVYFGKLEEQNDQQFSIAEVFFLRSQKTVSSQSEKNADGGVQVEDQRLNEMEFQLVRLADQFYAPEDRLLITSNQLLFWEPLAEDSRVIEAIKKYKEE